MQYIVHFEISAVISVGAEGNGTNKPKRNKLWNVFLSFYLNKSSPGLAGIHTTLKTNTNPRFSTGALCNPRCSCGLTTHLDSQPALRNLDGVLGLKIILPRFILPTAPQGAEGCKPTVLTVTQGPPAPPQSMSPTRPGSLAQRTTFPQWEEAKQEARSASDQCPLEHFGVFQLLPK